MPELPEAETIVQELRRTVPGLQIQGLEVLHPDLIRGAEAAAFRRQLLGSEIGDVTRRGKNIILDSTPAGTLVVNLGMSGRLLLRRPGSHDSEPTHPGVIFHLDHGVRLIYHDVRRFGRLELQTPEGHRRWSRTLGPEPLSSSFTGKRLGDALSRSRSPVHSWLLDQRRVAGVGNIYASEALHRARIHPRRPARSLEPREVQALHRSIRKVLREAIEAKGTTFRDYRTAAGDTGTFAFRLRVYGRGGEPCHRCRAPIQRTILSNRSAFLCPRCQGEAGGDAR